MFWTILFILSDRWVSCEAKMCVFSLGFNLGIYDKTIWAGESKCGVIFFHLIFDLLEISWQKKLRRNQILMPKLLDYSPLN